MQPTRLHELRTFESETMDPREYNVQEATDSVHMFKSIMFTATVNTYLVVSSAKIKKIFGQVNGVE